MSQISEQVSIVIPTVNAPILSQCLEAIFANTPLGYELILICDTPDESRLKLFKQLSQRDDIHIITNPSRIGVPRALNQGIDASTKDYIMLMNDDVIVGKGWLEPLVAVLKEHPEFGIVCPRVTTPDRNEKDYFAGIAECSLLSKELIQKIGKFDESEEFSHLCCDGDYYMRCINTGYRPHGANIAQVYHVVGQTIKPELTSEKLNKPMETLLKRYGSAILVDQHRLPPYEAPIKMHRIEWLRSKVSPKGTILEVGCKDNIIWRNTSFKVTTLDKSVRPEENCFPDIVGDAESLPFEDNHFDFVCESELLEHVPDPQKVLKEAVRVARSKVIITVPNEFAWPPELKPFQNPEHVRYYSKATFTEELSKAGLDFRVEEIVWNSWVWFGAEIYCKAEKVTAPKVASSMEWADYQFSSEQTYSLLTKELRGIEIDLGKDVPDSLHWSRRFEYPWAYTNLQPFTKDDITLDAGTGYTVFHLLISRMVREVHSVDIDANSVNWLNKVKAEKGFSNAFASLGSLTNLAFPDNYFNKAICISTLEHLPKNKVTAGIEELIRVSKPGGKIAITMDIVLEKTDKQTDLEDFEKIAEKYCFTIPNLPHNAMIFRVPPYNFPFAVACILLEKEMIK